MMELLAGKASRDSSYGDVAFMTGILSLLDALLEVPMSQVLGEISLPEEVREALLFRTGRLGHLLQVVEALEQGATDAVRALLAEDDPCDTAELPQLQIAALAWSNAIAEPLDHDAEARSA
jgi:c-di-GMP-related signal transduction protein